MEEVELIEEPEFESLTEHKTSQNRIVKKLLLIIFIMSLGVIPLGKIQVKG